MAALRPESAAGNIPDLRRKRVVTTEGAVDQQLRISATRLAELAMPGYCARCFWIKLRVPKQLPYQSFPAIFSSIDSYSKRLVHGWFDRTEGPPSWLAPLGELVGYKQPPHHSKFKILDEETSILLTGTPDGVFVLADGSHVIVDYKTSRYTPHQSRSLPAYEAQLNAYALIGAQCGINPVAALALVYTEPVTDEVPAVTDMWPESEGFAMGFSANIVHVELKPEMVHPLLVKAKEICDSPVAPSSRRGCRQCGYLNDLLGAVGV